MSFLNENMVYIPLILSIAVIILLIIETIIAKQKNSNYVNITLLLASVMALIGTTITIISTNFSFLAFTVLFENVLIIPTIFKLSHKNIKKNDNVDIKEVSEVAKKENEENIQSTETKDLLYETCYSIMSQATTDFSKITGLEKLLNNVNSLLCEETHADGCAILVLDDFEDVLHVKSFSGDFPPPYQIPDNVPHQKNRVDTNFKFADFPLEGNIFATVLNTAKAELIEDSISDNRIFKNGTEDFLKTGSYIFVPMKVNETVIGLVSLSRISGNPAFSKTEFETTKILTNFASVSLKTIYAFQEYVEHTELTKESEIALRIQKSINQSVLPIIPSLSIGKFFNPVEDICGDYSEIVPSRKDQISFIVADVAGKGMNSLVIMIMIRAILRLIVNTKKTAGTILSWANRGIAREKELDHYASLALVNYNSIKKEIKFSTAGTIPIIHYASEDGICRNISKNSEPLGVEKNTIYKDYQLALDKGDIIIMYTDGIVEAVNEEGEQYSSKRLCDIIEKHANLSGKKISEKIKLDIMRYCGETHQYDDQTLLVIKIQ